MYYITLSLRYLKLILACWRSVIALFVAAIHWDDVASDLQNSKLKGLSLMRCL